MMTYYVIRPTRGLLDQLRFGPPDAISILGNSVLWQRNEIAGRRSSESLATQVKLIFLLELKRTYLDYPESSEFKTLLGKLLGSPPFSVSLFDKWWELEHLDIEAQFDEVENGLDVDTLKLISPTGDPSVDAWMERLIKARMQA